MDMESIELGWLWIVLVPLNMNVAGGLTCMCGAVSDYMYIYIEESMTQ